MEQSLALIIYLSKYITDGHAFGNPKGKEVFQKLQDYISSCTNENIFGISLKDVKATDASFPRESIISLAKLYKGEKGFFLSDLSSDDICFNWHCAALAKKQPIIVLLKNDYKIIGPEIMVPGKELLDFIMMEGTATTSSVSKKFDVSAQNASAKLKKLFEFGLILRTKETAESGGFEFIYKAIK
jgi:hypothetical protein